MDLRTVSGDSVDRGYSHGLWCQCVLLISAWSPLAVQTMDILMAFGGNTGLGRQHRSQLL